MIMYFGVSPIDCFPRTSAVWSKVSDNGCLVISAMVCFCRSPEPDAVGFLCPPSCLIRAQTSDSKSPSKLEAREHQPSQPSVLCFPGSTHICSREPRGQPCTTTGRNQHAPCETARMGCQARAAWPASPVENDNATQRLQYHGNCSLASVLPISSAALVHLGAGGGQWQG